MKLFQHTVQFYEDHAFPVESIASFAMTGLHSNATVLVAATLTHREAIRKALGVAVVPCEGRLVFLDAEEMLSQFIVDDWPEDVRFLQSVGELIGAAARQGPVYMFGEMVAVLWDEGKCRAALRLEALWNELATRHSFSLLCAYPMQPFVMGNHTASFLEVCTAHNHIRAHSFGRGA